MLSFFSNRKTEEVVDPTAADGPLKSFATDVSFPQHNKVPEIDRLTYAVGDIHGMLGPFVELVKAIRRDAGDREDPFRLVMLGDYVDRGPDSAGVINALIQLSRKPWCELVLLRGNHEQTLLDFLDRPSDVGKSWFEYGGLATIHSYKINLNRPPLTEDGWWKLRNIFLDYMPAAHLHLLYNTVFRFDTDEYVFVHAGVDPFVPLSDQKDETLMWIRDRFLSVEKACSKVVVHGHTPQPEASVDQWRIGLDTGAYATGVLSAIRLEGAERRLIQVPRKK